MHNLTLLGALFLTAATAFLLNVNFMNLETNVLAAEMNGEKIAAHDTNPLLAEWTGKYGGVPAFDKVKITDFKPALEAAMTENLGEIDKIANNSAAPTFENTIAEMERAGHTLDRVQTFYNIWSGSMSSPEMRAVESEMDVKLAAFGDKITQNSVLFKRIEAVYYLPPKADFPPEQKRLTWRYYTNFVRAGAKLDAAKKARLSAIKSRKIPRSSNASKRFIIRQKKLTFLLNRSV